MAQAPQHPGGEGAAPFIRHIVPDPKNVPDVTLLTGYAGASSEEGHERLYLSADLTNYVDIPRAAILHQAPLPKEQDPHGGVTLWVKKDAALQYKMAPAAQALANYFAGAIQAGAQGAAAAAQPFPATFIAAACPPQTLLDGCAPTRIGCPHPTPFCPTHVGCPPTHIGCPPPTPFCPTRFGCPPPTPFCPTRVGCPPPPTPFCPTHHVTCAPVCTHATPCQPTRFEPQCPFPTEICTHVAGCHTQQFGFCPLPQAAAAGAGPGQSFVDCSIICPTRFGPCLSHQVTCAPCVTHVPVQCSIVCPTRFEISCAPCVTQHPLQCSIACPTRFGFSCAPCVTQHPLQCSIACPTRFEFSCNPVCHVTSPIVCQIVTNAANCPIATGAACPPVSLGCPQASLGCGGGFPQPGFGG